MSQVVFSETLIIPPELAGRRLDQALAELLPDYSRSRIKEWIDAGKVLLDGKVVRPRDRVAGSERVEVNGELTPDSAVTAEAIDLAVVHEDKDVLVVNKPTGLVVHPGAGNRAGTLQNALLNHDPKLAELPRAGLIHRLDKDTTGLLIVARTLPAHTALVQQLQAREIHRQYEAVCVGVMTAGGTVDAPIARHRTDRTRMTIRQDGRPSITHYRVLQRFRAHTYVQLQLDTGRTHQIRVHMASVGYPLAGDRTYGGRLLLPKGASASLVAELRSFPRQALHAARLEFEHPRSKKKIACEAPLPADMKTLLRALAIDAKPEAPRR